MTNETLHCQAGNHDWVRERKRGKKPANCPEHTTQREIADREEHMEKMRLARLAAMAERHRKLIVSWQEQQQAEGCTCEVKSTMTLRQINKLAAGCGPGWVCPHLDRLRRRLGH